MSTIHIIMPVKDSLDTAREAIAAVMQSMHEGADMTVYNDFSTHENTDTLKHMAYALGFRLVNWEELTDHPSPNYRLTLQDAQKRAIADGAHLVIVESDVTVGKNTIQQMIEQAKPGVGMVAAVTVDTDGNINFPYLYAAKMNGGTIATSKRFSFCCTLLTIDFLKKYSFIQLDPTKSWYDVAISHMSNHLGFRNLLMLDNRVLHRPHSSRPWKQLKYTNPLKYYWQKITRKRDRI